MKKWLSIVAFPLLINIITLFSVKAQTSGSLFPTLEKPDLCTNDQLIEPADLANRIKSTNPGAALIYDIGAVEDIKGAKHIGPVSNAANLEKWNHELTLLPVNTPLIIYCGCCPFAKCPNIRPAFSALKKLGFTNVKVLNLTSNLKTNWINAGYPLAAN